MSEIKNENIGEAEVPRGYSPVTPELLRKIFTIFEAEDLGKPHHQLRDDLVVFARRGDKLGEIRRSWTFNTGDLLISFDGDPLKINSEDPSVVEKLEGVSISASYLAEIERKSAPDELEKIREQTRSVLSPRVYCPYHFC